MPRLAPFLAVVLGVLGVHSALPPPFPSPFQPGIVPNCTNFYKVQNGDTCDMVKYKYGTFELEDFLKWNRGVNQACTNLWLGYYACVGVPGMPAPSPSQPGIVQTCERYEQARPFDGCQVMVNRYGTLTLEEFYEWNPAVKRDCSMLLAGNYYCIYVPPATPSSPPSPIQNGITPGCKEYYQVQNEDWCQKVVDKYNGRFTLDQFYSWNPAVKGDCSLLLIGYYVCVRV